MFNQPFLAAHAWFNSLLLLGHYLNSRGTIFVYWSCWTGAQEWLPDDKAYLAYQVYLYKLHKKTHVRKGGRRNWKCHCFNAVVFLIGAVFYLVNSCLLWTVLHTFAPSQYQSNKLNILLWVKCNVRSCCLSTETYKRVVISLIKWCMLRGH